MSPKRDQFLSLVLEHRKIIYKICHAYGSTVEDRQDLEQEIVMQLWQAADKYDPQYKLSTWIYRVALNVAISFLRREKSRKRQETNADQSLIERLEDESVSAELEANIDQLYRFINQLGELNRALMLLYLDDYAHKEIAEILGISATNVATKINRIKGQLKKSFLAETTS